MTRFFLFIVILLASVGAFFLFRPSAEPILPPEPELIPPPRLVVEVTPEVLAKLREIAHQAARDGDTQTLRDCLDAGVPINELNARGDTFLILATYHGHEATTRFLLQQPKVDLERCGRIGPALSGVAFKGDLKLAELLLKAGANVNAANPSGQTPLMFAALTGRTPMVEFLLAAGADPFAKDRSGKTPLDLARTQGATETVACLEAAMKK